MAQQASRSSVELYTNLYFKGKTLVEPAYIIRILKNGFVVLVPRYGFEGVVYTQPNNDEPPMFHIVDDALETIEGPVVRLELFQSVKVELTVEETGGATQRTKLRLKLIEPDISFERPTKKQRN